MNTTSAGPLRTHHGYGTRFHCARPVPFEGRRTPLTVYGYCVCPALSVPLPGDWRDIALRSLDLLTTDRYATLARCFGVMNASHLFRVTGDTEFRTAARARIERILDGVTRTVPTADARDVAAVQRAIMYGIGFVDERFGPALTVAARAYVRTVERLL